MEYEVIIPAPVQKQMDGLPGKEFENITTKIFFIETKSTLSRINKN
jgi:hypothetical protein